MRFFTCLSMLKNGLPLVPERLMTTEAVSDTVLAFEAEAVAVLTWMLEPTGKLEADAAVAVILIIWELPWFKLPKFEFRLPELKVKLLGKTSMTATLLAVALPVLVTTILNST